MALKKEVVTRQGYIAEYWKVNRCEIDKNNRTARCVLNLYKDESMSHVKDSYIGEQSRLIDLNNYVENIGINYTLHPEFDAVCIEAGVLDEEIITSEVEVREEVDKETTIPEVEVEDKEELPLDEGFTNPNEPTIDEEIIDPVLPELNPGVEENTPELAPDTYTDRFERYFGDTAIYDNIYEACYAMTKELESFFADAEDC